MLETERLHMRNLRADDLPDIFRYRNDIRCNRYQRYDDTGREYLRGYIEKYKSCTFPSKEEEQHYALCLPDDRIIGDVSVFWTEDDNCFTLGVTVDYQHQRQGYAYEMLRGICAVLRAEYPQADLVGLIERENTASVALFEKLGFVQECYAESIGSYVYVIYGGQQKGKE